MLYHRKLQFMSDVLTAAEQKVADYIEEHSEDIRSMSSSAMAEASGVSQPTVIRFSKKLGYSSYRHMVNDIGVEDPDADINMEVYEHADTRATNAQIAEQHSAVIRMTFSMNGPELVDRAVDMICGASRILVAGFSERNYAFADYLCYRFGNIGMEAFTHSHSSMIYSKLMTCRQGDVLILLSESGETRDLINFAKLAKQRGMGVISLTRPSSNTVQSLSDVNFKLMEYGARTFLRSCMIRMSVLCIFDMIFLNLVKRDYPKYRTYSVHLNRMTKLAYEVPDGSEK